MKIIGTSLLLYFLGVSAVFAVRVTTLYQGVLAATTQSAAERSQLASEALAQVFVKVSGSNDILTHSAVKEHLKAASSLIQEFSYTPAPKLSDKSKPYLLQLNFDPNGINKMLRDEGAPIWGQSRPLLLVWLENDVANHPRELIGANAENAISVMLKQNTDRRGVPVIFPAMDVEDLEQVSVNDVASMNSPKLLAATKRYGSDGILIGHIMQDTNGYTTQWKLIIGSDQWGWNMTGSTLQDILATMADHVADTLAGRYATVITNTVQSHFILKISHITEADDFVQAMNYIKHLTPVSNVELVQIIGSDLILKVSLRGTQESFTQALSVGQKLTPIATDGKQTMLVYQWNH